jgi:hypothetical protein
LLPNFSNSQPVKKEAILRTTQEAHMNSQSTFPESHSFTFINTRIPTEAPENQRRKSNGSVQGGFEVQEAPKAPAIAGRLLDLPDGKTLSAILTKKL